MPHALGETHRRAWESLLRAHAALIRRMNQAMIGKQEISLEVYDVLLSLEEAPERRLTMRELGERVVLTPSGVSRLIDRLEREGYVRREVNEKDRRSMYAVLTDAGQAVRAAAWPAFARMIREEFASQLTEEEARELGDLLIRFVKPGVGVNLYTP